MDKKIKKAMHYMCADSSSCFPSWQVKSHKLKWLKDCLLYRGITNDGEIVVTPVVIATDMDKTSYMMDCITGSLYKDGICKTSDYLMLLDVVEESGLAKELLTKKTKAMGA